MSLFTRNVCHASSILKHARDVLTQDRKTHGEVAEFFKAHGGLRLVVRAGDGTELPEGIATALTKSVEPRKPPALGNGRYQRAGEVPPSLANRKERDAANRARLRAIRDEARARGEEAPHITRQKERDRERRAKFAEERRVAREAKKAAKAEQEAQRKAAKKAAREAAREAKKQAKKAAREAKEISRGKKG